MNQLEVDVAVIGSGTAGLNARRAALDAGAKSVVLIEGGTHGTTCARVGCMPSKLLIAAAEVNHEIAHASQFGIDVPQAAVVDGRRVLKRVQSERDRFVGFVLEAVENQPEEQRLTGFAKFIAPNRLRVGDHTEVLAKAIVIAVGTTPFLPPPIRDLNSVGDRVLTNEHIFESEDLPKSLAVIGTGVIGIELGQAMHRLGVETTLINRSCRVGPLGDPAMQKMIIEEMSKELNLHVGMRDLEAELSEVGVKLRWTRDDGASEEIEVEKVLCAAGRVPHVQKLGLAQSGIELDAAGRPIFDPNTLQCGDAPIFVAGDITGERELLHEASDEGKIAGANAATFPNVSSPKRRVPIAVVFSDPQIGTVGDTSGGDDIVVGTVDYSSQGRARVMGKNQGRVNIYGRRSDRKLVGAEMFGPRVEHTSHLLAWSIQAGLTVDETIDMPFYHPVIEEGIRTGLQNLAKAMNAAEKASQ